LLFFVNGNYPFYYQFEIDTLYAIISKEIDLYIISGENAMAEEKKEEKEGKALGEQIWDSTKEFFIQVKEDADKSIKILSLKGEISRLEREKNDLFAKLGATTYQMITLGSIKGSELKPTAEKISKLEQEIEDKKREIKKIKDVISSPAPEEKPPAAKKQRKVSKSKAGKRKTKPKGRTRSKKSIGK